MGVKRSASSSARLAAHLRAVTTKALERCALKWPTTRLAMSDRGRKAQPPLISTLLPATRSGTCSNATCVEKDFLIGSMDGPGRDRRASHFYAAVNRCVGPVAIRFVTGT